MSCGRWRLLLSMCLHSTSAALPHVWAIAARGIDVRQVYWTFPLTMDLPTHLIKMWSSWLMSHQIKIIYYTKRKFSNVTASLNRTDIQGRRSSNIPASLSLLWTVADSIPSAPRLEGGELKQNCNQRSESNKVTIHADAQPCSKSNYRRVTQSAMVQTFSLSKRFAKVDISHWQGLERQGLQKTRTAYGHTVRWRFVE